MKLKLDSFVSMMILSGFCSKQSFCQSTKGDNVSYLLNSFQEGYDRRLRPNYGGKSSNASLFFSVFYVISLTFYSSREFCLWKTVQLTQPVGFDHESFVLKSVNIDKLSFDELSQETP